MSVYSPLSNTFLGTYVSEAGANTFLNEQGWAPADGQPRSTARVDGLSFWDTTALQLKTLVDGVWTIVGPTPGGSGFWQRADLAPDGFAVFPVNATDDVVIGPSGAPTAKLFQDGDAVFGAGAMIGTERVRIVGDLRLEGGIVGTGGSITGDWGVGNDLDVNNDLDVGGDGDITGRLDVGTDADIGNDLGVTNDVTVAGQTVLGGAAPVGSEVLRAQGDVLVDSNGKILVADSATVPPLNISERATAPSAPATEDIYLDDGTNTASGDPGWRRYTGAVWEDIGAVAGGGSSPWTDGGTLLYPTNDETVAIGDSSMALNERLLVVNKDPASGSHLGILVGLGTPASGATIDSWVGILSAPQVNSSDTLTEGEALKVATPAGTGTITDYNGIEIEDISSGTPTFTNTPYAIYQKGASDLNYFAGSTGIGATAMSGSEKLRVVGSSRFEGALDLIGANDFNVASGAITVGGGPNGKWFNDGDMVLGGSTMSGTEKLRVVGKGRIEGDLEVTGIIDPTALILIEQASVPGGVPIATRGTLWMDSADDKIYFTNNSTTYDLTASGGSSPWTDGGAFLYPTASETVAIGATAMVGSEQLRVRSADTSGLPAGIRAELDTGGSLTSWEGLQVQADINAGHVVGSNRGVFLDNPSGAGTVTTAYGLQIDDQGLNSTTAYGVYIDGQAATTAYGIFQAGSSNLNNFAGFMELGQDLVLNEQSDHQSTPTAGTGILWVKDDATTTLWFTNSAGGDTQLGAGGGSSPWTDGGTLLYPTNDETVAIGTTAMSGTLKEMVRVLCDANPAAGDEHIGFLSDHTDTDALSGNTWTGFAARGVSTAATSPGTFIGYSVVAPASTYVGGWSIIGYRYPDMTGTPFAGSIGFEQLGANESNQFNGSMGIGGGTVSGVGLRVSTRAAGITGAYTNVQVYRNVDNTLTGPGQDWTAFDAEIVQSFTSASPHYMKDVRYYSVQSPSSSRPVTIANAYGLHIENLQADADFTYTNTPYGVYQAGALDRNFFSGVVGVGTIPSSGSKVEVNQSFSGSDVDLAAVEAVLSVSSGASERNAAVRGETQIATGTSGLVFSYGVMGKAEAAGTAQVTNLIGINSEAVAAGSGIIGNLIGHNTQLTVGASGSVSNSYGFLVRGPTIASGGSITAAYGLRVEGQGVTGVTNSYGIWQQSSADTNFFSGRVGVGINIVSSTDVALDAGGTAGTLGAFMAPRMTNAQRTGLTPQDGMIVYDTTSNAFYFRENGAWVTGSGLT